MPTASAIVLAVRQTQGDGKPSETRLLAVVRERHSYTGMTMEFNSEGVRTTHSNRSLIKVIRERLPVVRGEVTSRRNFDYQGPPCTECGGRAYRAQVTDDLVQGWCSGCTSEYRKETREHDVARPGSRYRRMERKTTWSQRSPAKARSGWFEKHPTPVDREFFAYWAEGPLRIALSGPSASIARGWPAEHRWYDLRAVRSVPFAASRKVFGWFLRSPVEGVDVRALLDEIDHRTSEERDEAVAEVVSSVLQEAADGMGFLPIDTRLGELWRARPPARAPQSELWVSGRLAPGTDRIDIEVAIGDGMIHRIVHANGKNTALDHGKRKTSRGVSIEVCARCHHVLAGLEAFGQASSREVYEWIDAGIDLATAAKWRSFATPDERIKWLDVGFSASAAGAWASECGPVEALERAERGDAPPD